VGQGRAVKADEKAALIRRGLGGQHLAPWLPDGDHKAARSLAVQGWAGGNWGQTEAKGIRGAAGFVTWREVIEVVERGCRAPGLRQAYEAAYADWCGWAYAGGYSPEDADWTQDRRDAHDQWYRRAGHAIRRTTAAIIEAGCRDDVDQETLF
jgi:hypothetical protein